MVHGWDEVTLRVTSNPLPHPVVVEGGAWEGSHMAPK